jgi:hypothetical protein
MQLLASVLPHRNSWCSSTQQMACHKHTSVQQWGGSTGRALCLRPALHPPCCRSDYFETLEECALLPGCLPVGLGPGCTARKCIIDKNSRIGANVQIINKDGVQVRLLDSGFRVCLALQNTAL